jgi:PilZ domain/Flagellar protein YcgR
MSDKSQQAERDKIKVGRPLPFSVFGAEGQLLLAEGTIVESDHTRLQLLRSGVYCDAAETPSQTNEPAADSEAPGEQTPLSVLRRDYAAAGARRRLALTIAAGDSEETQTAWVLGVHDKSILLTAPRLPNGSLLPVKVGHSWVCRAFQLTTAFRFRSNVLKVVFEPFPQVLIEAPQHVEQRTVRSRPRAAVFMPVTIEAPQAAGGIMVDLSVGGGRIAVEQGSPLDHRGQALQIDLKLEMIDSRFELSLKSSIVAVLGACDARHPRVHFYGIKFENPNEIERLVLHAYVSGQLALEANALWRLLTAAVPVTGKEKQ